VKNGPDGMRPSATVRNNAASGQLVGKLDANAGDVAKGEFATIRERLIKIGARVIEQTGAKAPNVMLGVVGVGYAGATRPGRTLVVAFVAATPAAARELTPLEAVAKNSEGYDPFRAPKHGHLPDDYVDGKPYWLPTPPPTAITREVLSSPAATAMAADKPLDGYDPYRRPVPDRVPDDYVDGRPYWLPGPELASELSH
jgi:hypothetical protein